MSQEREERQPVQCVECVRGWNGERSCSAGWTHKRKGPACFVGTKLPEKAKEP